MATSLRTLLDAIGDPLISVLAAPRGLGVEIFDVVIVDPEDPPDRWEGALALVIGARGTAAAPVVRTVARGGAAAVAVKDADHVTEAAADAGVALLAVGAHARWERLEALARGVVDAARATGDAETGEVLGDLFTLAQTIAVLTGGLVTIEDTANRVLAYSRAGDEADTLRRLSILGRQGPERYLAMLREWGVYQRLRAGEGVVCIEERPDLGIRRRLAAGIHAGSRPLGSVWVQEGAALLAANAETTVLGASRTLAPYLIRHRTQTGPGLRWRDDLLASLLDGRLAADSVAEDIGADPERPALVVAFDLDHGTSAAGAGGPLKRAELIGLISLHTAAYRRGALVGVRGGRVYALLPDLTDGAEARVLTLARAITGTARRHLGVPVRAALGGVVARLSETPASCADADRVLDIMAGDPSVPEVATFAELQPRVLLSEVVAFLADRPHVQDSWLRTLAEYDDRHGAALIASLTAYLDALGDVRRAAAGLNVHPNTLRYRIRRCLEISGLDLDDPDERLLAQLQLRIVQDHRRPR